MKRFILLAVLMPSLGCTIKPETVVMQKALVPPASLVPEAQGQAFGLAVSRCRAYGSSLSQFAERVKSRQGDSGTWAAVFGALTAATGATVTAVGGYYSGDTTAHKDDLAVTALAGGLVTAGLAIPTTILGVYTKTQNTEATAARTAAKAIDDTIIRFSAEIYKAAEKTTDAEKSNFVYTKTEELLSECHKNIHALDVPNVPEPSEPPGPRAAIDLSAVEREFNHLLQAPGEPDFGRLRKVIEEAARSVQPQQPQQQQQQPQPQQQQPQ